MKNVKILFIGILTLGVASCQNEDWEFPDFDYTAVYFPYQYPVRTLVLGDYVYDNENDNNMKFTIAARIGGMYENHSTWNVEFKVAEELAENLLNESGDTIRALPSSYYTLSSANELVIPKGEFDGRVEVQLTDAFFQDTLAVKGNYVIPLMITSTNADSVLRGLPGIGIENPDPRIASEWSFTPKNFTLFGIKYVNQYHGKYLLRGQCIIKDIGGNEVKTVVYREKYVVDDEVWFLETTSKNEVAFEGRGLRGVTTGSYSMKLTFDENNNCTITKMDDSPLPVTGSGEFVKDGDEWGGEKRNAIRLTYDVNDGTYIHSFTDTLVFRDKAVTFEEFQPVVIKE